jgi:hypothetical protein
MARARYIGIMPRFTRENAAEMAKLSHSPNSARNLQPETTASIIATAGISADERRKQTLAQQIDLLDKMIAKTNGGGKVLQYIAAKAKLWELLYPKPGSLRPKQSRSERVPVQPIQPLPIETQPALVAPSPEQNHNVQIIQSQVPHP